MVYMNNTWLNLLAVRILHPTYLLDKENDLQNNVIV